ncbi:MAG: hypothetical protein ACRYG2_11225 [Janthinobacterium lividum]
MPRSRSVFAGFAQLAEEVGQASRANRELFEQLVAAEVGRVAGRLGVVPAAELRDARQRLDSAEDELAVLRLELDDLQLRVATLEAGSPDAQLVDAQLVDEELVLDPTLSDAPDLLGDETGAAGVRG